MLFSFIFVGLMMISMVKLVSVYLMFIFCIFMLMASFSPLVWAKVYESIFVDSLSFGLMFLSLCVIYLMMMSMPAIYKTSVSYAFYYILILMFVPILLLCFFSGSVLLFYFGFEVSLIPTFFLISGWGYQVERVQSIFYFLLYTIFASLPFLLFLLSLETNSLFFFSLVKSSLAVSGHMCQLSLGWGSLMAFLAKMPIYMMHLWLPKAHVEAPVTGSMILAAVLLKLGGYGMLRVLSIIKMMSMVFNLLFSLSSLSVILVGLMCLKLNDMKSLVAYSSVAHMAMALISIYTMYNVGCQGALLMLLSHGLCSSSMFYFIGVIYNMTKSRSMMINKSLSNLMKGATLVMFLIFTPNMATPMTMNLFSEIYILMSLINFSLMTLIYILIGMLFVAYFTMLLFSYVSHGVLNSMNVSFYYLTLENFLVVLLHIFLINLSFTFINIT